MGIIRILNDILSRTKLKRGKALLNNKTISLGAASFKGETLALGSPLISENIVFHKQLIFKEIPVSDKDLTKPELSAEMQRFKTAKISVQKELENIQEELEKKTKNSEENQSQKAFYEFYLTLLNDRHFSEQDLKNKLNLVKKPIEFIIKTVILETEKKFLDMPSDYLKARAPDILSFGELLLKHLGCIEEDESLADKIAKHTECLLVTNDFAAHHIHLLYEGKLKGIITEQNKHNQHQSIMAREQEIPFITKIFNADLMGATSIFINPYESTVWTNQSSEQKLRCERIIKNYQQTQLVANRVLTKRSLTLDRLSDTERKPFHLYANLSSRESLLHRYSNYIENLGLVRTELLYHQSSIEPNFSTQVDDYKNILGKFPNAIIRMFDLAPDKQLKFFTGHGRGLDLIKNSPANYQIYVNQLKAMITAAKIKGIPKLSVLVPMIKNSEDITFFKLIINEALNHLEQEGIMFTSDKINLGIMIETQEILDNLEDVMQKINFASLGTNDMGHYVFHENRFIDQSKEEEADIYLHELNPYKLLIYEHIIKTAIKNNIPIGVCGSLAENQDWAFNFMGMGANYLSVPMACFPDIKTKLRSVFLDKYQQFKQIIYDLEKVKNYFIQTAGIKEPWKTGTPQFKKALAYQKKIPMLNDEEKILHNSLLMEATNAILHEMNTRLRPLTEEG